MTMLDNCLDWARRVGNQLERFSSSFEPVCTDNPSLPEDIRELVMVPGPQGGNLLFGLPLVRSQRLFQPDNIHVDVGDFSGSHSSSLAIR